MKPEAISRAITEAKRFIRTAEAALRESPDVFVSRKRSACRRASLDLSQALADLRRREQR